MSGKKRTMRQAYQVGIGRLSIGCLDWGSGQRAPSAAVILIVGVGLGDVRDNGDEIHTPSLREGRKVVDPIP